MGKVLWHGQEQEVGILIRDIGKSHEGQSREEGFVGKDKGREDVA